MQIEYMKGYKIQQDNKNLNNYVVYTFIDVNYYQYLGRYDY